jgi:cyclophilin family peptidyl-prolyl cis-trans isomerase
MDRPRTGRMCYARLTDAVKCLAALLLVTALGCRNEGQEAASAPADTSAPASDRQPADLAHPAVRIETTMGAITVELDAAHAPGTVNNFLNHVREGFYSDTIIHYVDPGNMILGGGYAADRRLKPAGMAIRNEAHNGLKNLRGTIVMARDQGVVDSATSQFFINLADAPQRDHQGESPEEYGYCVFGRVTEGLDVAERISQSPTQDLGGDLVQSPQPPVVIRSIRIVQ